MKLFLDPAKTLSTCKEKDCQNCEVTDKVTCHFNGKQLALFIVIILPVLLTGGIFIYSFNLFLLIFWIFIMILYFGFFEIAVMCSHCPHYAEPDLKSLKCWANYGAPKIWKFKPGPMSSGEKIVFFTGLAIILLFPAFILMIQKRYFLLLIFLILLILWKISLRFFFCRICINFACPFNAVEKKSRDYFFEKNIDIQNAWNKKIN